jgi:uncharacterized protein (UPF0333 family)
MKRKAQVAMEYIIIVAFVAVITVPLIVVFMTQSDETNDDVKSNQVYQIAKKISDSAESVYYLGEPSKTTLKMYFPRDIFLTSIGNKEIVFKMKTKNGVDDVVVMTSVDVNGTLPTKSGVHYIKIESKGDYVWIGT